MTEASASRSRKRPLRKPVLLVLAVVIVLLAALALFNRDDYAQADLPFIAKQIQEHKVWSATVRDKEQRIEITTIDGKRFQAEWEKPDKARELTDALRKAEPKNGYTIEVSTTWILLGPFEIFVGAVLVAVLVAVSRRLRRFQKDR
ncbi:hypothetical protein [Microtetraspora fusca]|uniref:hypothetical protein n=1 Tax=Microtetraspora fusca TaxID=1997 RepID=UPI000B298BEF|nr:hypothetical protein [Microtetraspora fusca]